MKNWLEHFKEACRSIGVKQGDLLYISSDITMLLYRVRKEKLITDKGSQEQFMSAFADMLQELVGEQGTLLIPMFSWTFCKGVDYDARTTPGEVGALGNWILQNRSDFQRTEHPLYSFMVWGREAQHLCGMHNVSAWGEDSPFAYLHHHHGKNLLLNVSIERSFTFAHYVEECIHVPFRYHKDFRGSYTDADGQRSERTYSMYVRDLDIESSQITPETCFDGMGISKSTQYDHNTLKLIDLEQAYPVVADNFLHHNGSDWYVFQNYVIDWEGGQTHPNHRLSES